MILLFSHSTVLQSQLGGECYGFHSFKCRGLAVKVLISVTRQEQEGL